MGTNFTGATNVTIGGNACQSFTVVSDTLIECTGPNTSLTANANAVVVSKSAQNSNNTIAVTYNATAYPTLQDSNAYANCNTTATIFRDTRDSQLYYVKKMQDNKCWMVDNLKYVDNTVLNTADGTAGMTLNDGQDGLYNTANGSNTQSATNSDKAFYNTPMGTTYCTGTTDIPASTVTRCGYLYNWYAATAGTGTYDEASAGEQVSDSICPTGFRLPSAISGTSGPTTTGTSYKAADFPVLSASMYEGGLTTGATTSSYGANWRYDSAWQGVYSGSYNHNSLDDQGSYGDYWSSTADSNTYAQFLHLASTYVNPGNVHALKRNGLAVRCVKDAPPTPPAGTNPDNISSTNTATLDVYPTTGWTGDTVAITSNALFTNVQSVTIGGTACSDYGVITTSLITCKLPAKTAGTTNDIVVMNGSTNVTSTATYDHMKITYFNPSASSVTVNGTSFKFYPNSFTSANCSALTASNSTSDALPDSIAYVRDTRNNQTYRVKRMIDNKCWMIDNLKYIDTTITNVDGTTGMVYNNGDHLGNGGGEAYDTVDESLNQSAANYDKAFYNNPMSNSYCYGTTDMPANTLTRCGYLYNWYAATGGTGTYSFANEGNQVAGNICPTGFRLPSVTSGTDGPTYNGTYTTVADFPVLNASMNAGTSTIGSATNYYANWLYGGAWQGVYSGYYQDRPPLDSGGTGVYWSSTAYSYTDARNLGFNGSTVWPATNRLYKYMGQPVRCLMP